MLIIGVSRQTTAKVAQRQHLHSVESFFLDSGVQVELIQRNLLP